MDIKANPFSPPHSQTASTILLRTILDSLESLCAILDQTGDIIFVNQAWRRFAINNGGDVNKVSEGQNYIKVCLAAESNEIGNGTQIAQIIQDTLDGKRETFEIVNTCHLPTEKKWYLERITSFKYGGVPFALILHEDVTRAVLEEKHRERASRIDALGVLAGGIAHDFNNLILTQLANLELAQRKLEHDHRAFSNIEAAISSLRQASSLSNQLLTFTKGGDPVFEPLCVQTLIENGLILALAGDKTNVKLQFPEEACFILGDESQLLQVITNLLVNSREVMSQGENLYIEIFTDRDLVNVQIRDEGPGIPHEIIERIFEPFFTTKELGHGLGLAVAHNIIDKHRGTLSVDSCLGEGSTFLIQLPRADTNQVDFVSRERIAERPNADINLDKLILVADDNETLQTVIKEILDYHAYDAVVVKSGEEAIDQYTSQAQLGNPFNLVILDLELSGGIGGIEAAKKMLAFDPKAKIILSSGHTYNSALLNFQAFGFIDVLVKPYHMNELLEKIEQWTS